MSLPRLRVEPGVEWGNCEHADGLPAVFVFGCAWFDAAALGSETLITLLGGRLPGLFPQ
jgi:hypothetical protein